jgi:hypothetical protein
MSVWPAEPNQTALEHFPFLTLIVITYAISSTYEWLGSQGNGPVKGASNWPLRVLRSELRLHSSYRS